MPDLAFDLRYLKYAVLAAECGSFRRAAETLNVPQSTVSRRILLLEHRIGIALFDRTRKGARLTIAGERFLKDVSPGAELLRSAVNALMLARRGETGEVRIGLMASLASGFLSELLSAYRQDFPGIELKVEETNSMSNMGAILSGRLDVAFIPGRPQMPGCKTEMLWSEDIYLVVPATHYTAGLEAVALGQVKHENFIAPLDATGPEIEAYLVRELSENGFRPKITFQGVGRENLLNMVRLGFGITLTTTSTLGVSYPGIQFIRLAKGECSVGSSMIWSSKNSNPALKLLIEMSLERAHRTSMIGCASTK